MESPKKTAARAKARRRRLLVRIGFGLAAVVAVGAIVVSTRGDDGSDAAGTTPGFTDEDRTIDTAPFELAGPNVTGPTTIPGNLGQAGQPTLPPDTMPPATAPASTQPLPDVPPSDPVCVLTKSIIEGIRFVEGPGGASPENLRAASGRFREAAEVAVNSGRADVAPLALLATRVSIELPGAKTLEEAKAIYQILTSPTDPLIQQLLVDFGPYLRDNCPGLIPE